ncbi:hypothetical protein MKX01_037669 [Papaver californicum]|nr:hypothetical protein MKX01_037669 [Papaver californicum]
MFNIPKSVKITKMKSITDPVGKDEVVASLYQLACGLPMPIDSFTCELLNAWGISVQQMHPSLCLALKRVLCISNTYLRFILPVDVQQFIVSFGQKVSGLPWKIFSCQWKLRHHFYRFQKWQKDHKDNIPTLPTDNIAKKGLVADNSSDDRIEKFFDLPNSLFDVSISDEYVGWCYDRDLNANKISAPTHAVPLNQKPGITIIDSDSESYDCSSPKAPNMNSKKTYCCQESSPPSSLIRIPRRRYKTSPVRYNSLNGYGASDDRTKLKRLRKRDHPKPFTHTARSTKRPFVNTAFSSMSIPDAMSGKICQVVRRSQRLFNKDYIFQEESLCASDGGFSPGFDGNRESMNSSSSDEVVGMETESSEDISSGGPPSPSLNLNPTQAPLGREAMRGNDFSNTYLLTIARLTKITRLLPVATFYHQFLNSVAQLNDAHNQRSLASSADAGARQEILRLKSENTELSSTVRALTEELTRVRQDLTDSNARESQLQSSFNEIKDVLRKVLGGTDFLPGRQTL